MTVAQNNFFKNCIERSKSLFVNSIWATVFIARRLGSEFCYMCNRMILVRFPSANIVP